MATKLTFNVEESCRNGYTHLHLEVRVEGTRPLDDALQATAPSMECETYGPEYSTKESAERARACFVALISRGHRLLRGWAGSRSATVRLSWLRAIGDREDGLRQWCEARVELNDQNYSAVKESYKLVARLEKLARKHGKHEHLSYQEWSNPRLFIGALREYQHAVELEWVDKDDDLALGDGEWVDKIGLAADERELQRLRTARDDEQSFHDAADTQLQ